ncbi:MAG: hypothetical protein HWQ41_12260 [Nostoc sp. NOS(2021)]|uniref:hypothetical protein n=1 Tax=Nostoc sp. NOS(2021) TaxID=2815407 RepID=UPI0025DD1279|nr:hypothetical protein [Nostoc sp. NOS(2021)]MBN3896001.1 hypothetical protein [Nostoc sp. NOS(2021)]
MPESAIERQDNNKRLIPPNELNDKISDRVNQAILHAMELEPDKRPQTVEDWLKELGWRRRFTFPSLGNKRLQVLVAAIFAAGVLITKIEPLISALNNGVQLIDRFFSSPSTPTNPSTQQTPSSHTQPQNR